MNKKELLVGKHCKLDLITDFVLEGRVIDVDEYGIVFETKTKTSFISWNGIRSIAPEE